jgi:hypothetical protein
MHKTEKHLLGGLDALPELFEGTAEQPHIDKHEQPQMQPGGEE